MGCPECQGVVAVPRSADHAGARDVKLRYRQTALGAVWVILQPLLAAGIFAFVFGKVAKLPSDGVPYFLFSYAGLLGWNAFSSTLTKVSTCLVQNSPLVSKVFFPRLVLPLSTVFSTLIDFGVALAMMAVLMVIYGVAPAPGPAAAAGLAAAHSAAGGRHRAVRGGADGHLPRRAVRSAGR